MEIRRPTAQEKDAVRRLWDLSFPEGGPAYVDWVFEDLYRPAEALALFEGGQMAASLMMAKYTMALRGRATAVETLSGVDTDPAFRRQGYAKTLMAAALRDMADRGVGFNFLFPFDHCFYQRLGWQTVSFALEYTCPAVELPPMPAGLAVVPADRAAMAALYGRVMAGYNCRILRGEPDWGHRFGENRSLGGFVLAVAGEGKLRGYAFCEPAEEEINLGELVAESPTAARAVLAGLAPHGKAITWKAPADDRLSLTPGRWYGRIRRQPHTMMRIADLGRAVAQMPAEGSGQVTLEIDDALCPWNAGRWLLTASAGTATARKVQAEGLATARKIQAEGLATAVPAEGSPVEYYCDIGTFCRILTGCLTGTEALRWGLARGEDGAAALLDRLYPPQNNFTHELY